MEIGEIQVENMWTLEIVDQSQENKRKQQLDRE